MKKLWFALSLMLVPLAASSDLGHRQDLSGLNLTLQSDKQSYLPGESLSLSFSFTNGSKATSLLYGEPTVWCGNLKVFIAYEAGPFMEYFGPGWGTRDRLQGQPLKLLPGESFETEATVLWNQKIETGHLSEMYAKKQAKQRLDRDYALAEAGKYYIKAVLYNPSTGTTVESTPLLLTVENPQGNDLDVWKSLKQDGQYALFIQTGGLLEDPKGPRTTKVAKQLEKLISDHPDSRYASPIRQSLSKRQEAIEHMERQNE